MTVYIFATKTIHFELVIDFNTKIFLNRLNSLRKG